VKLLRSNHLDVLSTIHAVLGVAVAEFTDAVGIATKELVDDFTQEQGTLHLGRMIQLMKNHQV
jgi:hypothetical protein